MLRRRWSPLPEIARSLMKFRLKFMLLQVLEMQKNYNVASLSSSICHLYFYFFICFEQGLVARGRDCFCCFTYFEIFICGDLESVGGREK